MKIINLITSLSFAQRGKKTHQWDSENIFTEAEAGTLQILQILDFAVEGANGSG